MWVSILDAIGFMALASLLFAPALALGLYFVVNFTRYLLSDRSEERIQTRGEKTIPARKRAA